jgi:hypothetical protein
MRGIESRRNAERSARERQRRRRRFLPAGRSAQAKRQGAHASPAGNRALRRGLVRPPRHRLGKAERYAGASEGPPGNAHDYLFLLTKSARYAYDADAIKEPVTGRAHSRGKKHDAP